MERTISLLYHDVVAAGAFASSGFRSPDADIYKLDEAQFAAHLSAITRRVTPSARLFTFDDGGASATRIGDLLAERGWRGCFFIATDFIGRHGFATKGDLRALAAQGHAVGSHSCSHPARMAALTRDELNREWIQSRHTLEDILGQAVHSASIPGGYYSPAVSQAAAEAEYRELFTSEPVATPWQVGGLRVFGRYSVVRSTSPERVAALAAGDAGPRLEQLVYWNAKKVLKRAGGTYWLRFRKVYLRLRQPAEQLEQRP
jgi:peptidoglycan/xylan/chitin deacetylase (PgdA/CDA1 family)